MKYSLFFDNIIFLIYKNKVLHGFSIGSFHFYMCGSTSFIETNFCSTIFTHTQIHIHIDLVQLFLELFFSVVFHIVFNHIA